MSILILNLYIKQKHTAGERLNERTNEHNTTLPYVVGARINKIKWKGVTRSGTKVQYSTDDVKLAQQTSCIVSPIFKG